VKTGAAWRVYILGGAMTAGLIVCARHFTDRGGPYFMASLAFACVGYLLSVREFFATPKFRRRVVVLGLVLGAAWQVVFLRLPAGFDDDIHRYVWDGRLQRLGYNPYLVVPGDPGVRGLHTPETRSLNNPDLASPYPPGAQLFFRTVTAIRESTFALKLAFVLCDFAIAALLLNLLRYTGRPEHLVLVFAWNPLLAVEVAGSGHIDIVGALLLVLSSVALVRRWRAIAALSFGLAIAVKFLPIVLLPLYWKRVRIRDAALTAVAVGALYLPFLNHGRVPTGSLGTYVQNFRFNGPVFAAVTHLASPRVAAALAVLVGLATALWMRRRSKQSDTPHEQFAWPLAAALFCAPAVFPWYLLWLLPFLTSTSTLLILVWTASIIPAYVQWHLRTLGHPWGALPVWTMVVEYGCVGIAGCIIGLRRIRHKQRLGG